MTDELEMVFEVDSVTYRPNDRVAIASTPATGLTWAYPSIQITGAYVDEVDPDVCRLCRAYLNAVAPPRSRVCAGCRPRAVAEARR